MSEQTLVKNTAEKKTHEEIVYEEITVKVPRAIMDFLRANEDKPIEYIEYSIVDFMHADVEAGVFNDPTRLAEKWCLNPVFQRIIGHTVR